MSKTKPPKLKFRDADPLQDYYDNGRGEQFSVAKLIDDTKDLEPFDCPLAALDLSGEIWQGKNIYCLAFHVKKVSEADLSKPIILDCYGSVADGRHRIIKALTKGHRTIKAVRMTWSPEPCRKVED